ncbi:MAG: hypothetical protein QNJ54_09720 [Prochloraceae cyanobacterium]|nr:hypothetical protein [Prochloraceae cyanobacterium]
MSVNHRLQFLFEPRIPRFKNGGVGQKTIATEAKRQKLATHDYLIQKTGWILNKELYYPPDRS